MATLLPNIMDSVTICIFVYPQILGSLVGCISSVILVFLFEILTNMTIVIVQVFLVMLVKLLQVFIFVLSEVNWVRYDWSRVTTVVQFMAINDSLTCFAHSKGARSVYGGRCEVTLQITGI